jgi:hypothetical protein
MIQLRKFEHKDGKPDEMQVEEWTETYFFNLMTVLNSFLSHVDVAEAVIRLKSIPFDQLVREELEGEQAEVLEIASARINELAEAEIAFLESYIES